MPQANRKIRIERSYGRAEVRSSTLDKEARTVEVMWSSGIAVKRYSWDEGFYMEELSMDPKAIRMVRFEAGMSLLDSHRTWSMESRLGTVVPKSVRIEGGKGYATIKFSRNEVAETLFQDLVDGHPVQISVGYKIHSYQKVEGKGNELPILRAIDWEPTELSIVSVPAEPGASSRSEDGAGEGYEVVLTGQEEQSDAATAARSTEPAMDKITAARNLKGKELDTLARGAGITRSANETDEALSARLVAHFEAAQRAEDESQKRQQEEEARLRAEKEAKDKQRQQQTRTDNAPPAGLTQDDVTRAVAQAQQTERKRQQDIRELARTANVAEDSDVVRGALNSGHTLDEFRSAMLDHLIKEENRSPTFPHSNMRGMQDERETRIRLAVNGLMHRHGLTEKLEDGANQYRSLSTLDLARDLLIANGGYQRGMSSVDIVRTALAQGSGATGNTRSLHTTSDFPLILGEVTRQVLLASYAQYQNTFTLIANRNTVADLREVKVLELGEGPQLEKINEKGEYKRGTVKESQEGFTLAHYGKVIGLTEAMLINDQLGAFARLIAGWGRVVVRLEGDIVWDQIISNAKLKSDGKGLCHTDHGNLGTGAALDKTPAVFFSISANGVDVTDRFRGAAIAMTITDGEGLKADTLQITLDDPDGSVVAPTTGAILNPVGGYEDETRDFGLFVVDNVGYTGWPQQILINAKSLAAKSLAKQREPKAYTTKDFPTYGDIFAAIAKSIGMPLHMAEALKALANPYEAQSEEDGLEFLTRLGEKINAAVAVKSLKLVVVEKGAGRSAGGGSLDHIIAAYGVNLISYNVSEKDEPKHEEVEATYYDRGKNSRESVSVATGMDGPKYLLRAPFQERDEAERAAKAKAKELVRAQADGTFVIDGSPFAQAEAYASVSGCRPRVDGLWRVKSATHSFSATGPYTTTLQCEVPSS